MKTKYRIIQRQDGRYTVQYKFKYFLFYGQWHETTPYFDYDEAKKLVAWFIQRDHERKQQVNNDFKIIQEEIETES
jgi:hypothetical protein